ARADLKHKVFGRASLEGHAVLETLEVDAHEVSFFDHVAPGFHQLCLPLAILLEHIVDHVVRDDAHLARHRNAFVLAELDLGLQLHEGAEPKWFAGRQLDDVDFGLVNRLQAVFFDRGRVRLRYELVEGILVQHLGAEHALEYGAGHLAFAEARDRHITDDFSVSSLEGSLDALPIDLDLQFDTVVLQPLYGRFHYVQTPSRKRKRQNRGENVERMVREGGIEPPCPKAHAPKACAYTCSATLA